nr:NADH-quinone oxidoreductase subunit J [uncultured Nocardioides sp.]
MTVTFWLLAAIIVPAALGVLFVRKAVHGALLLAVVMISLAVLYLTLEAPFLFAVQIIVYTGAILMLFLFVVMLVGVDASDSVVETIRGQRWLAWGAGVVMGALLLVAVAQISLGTVRGLEEANAGGNIEGLADLLFSRYVLAFEVTAALLITAAMGAMVLAHRERLTPKPTQASTAARRVRDYAESGKPLGPLPSPGVYARHNAVDTPALLPDGTPAEESVARVLAARGTVRSAPALADDIDDGARNETGHPCLVAGKVGAAALAIGKIVVDPEMLDPVEAPAFGHPVTAKRQARGHEADAVSAEIVQIYRCLGRLQVIGSQLE